MGFRNPEGELMALLIDRDGGLQDLVVVHCCKDLRSSFFLKTLIYRQQLEIPES